VLVVQALVVRQLNLVVQVQQPSATHLFSSAAATGDGTAAHRAHIYASLTPRKDAEMIIYGRSLTSQSFAVALHAALRVLVDDLESPSFNAAVAR
jgi:hypothetical protein